MKQLTHFESRYDRSTTYVHSDTEKSCPLRERSGEKFYRRSIRHAFLSNRRNFQICKSKKFQGIFRENNRYVLRSSNNFFLPCAAGGVEQQQQQQQQRLLTIKPEKINKKIIRKKNKRKRFSSISLISRECHTFFIPRTATPKA